MFTSIGPAVNVLNELFDLDPAALHALQAFHVPCTKALADHPTVQVLADAVIRDGNGFTLGIMGLINGALTAATGEIVASRWTHRRDHEGHFWFDGFCVYNPEDRADIPKVPVPDDPWEEAQAALQDAVADDFDAVHCAMRAKCPKTGEWNHKMVPQGWSLLTGEHLLNAVLQAVFGHTMHLSDHDRAFHASE